MAQNSRKLKPRKSGVNYFFVKNVNFLVATMAKPELTHSEHLSAKPSLWLIFSLYYFIPMFYEEMSLVKIALLIGAYFAFLGIFLWAITLRPKRAWMGIGLLLALSTITSLHTSGANVFFPYLAFLIGFNYSRDKHIALLLPTVAVILGVHFSQDYPIPYFLLPALSTSVVVSIFGVIERMRLDTRLQWIQSRHEIEQLAVIAERERIARDLHDLLGHTLSSIALKAELAEKLLKQQKYEQTECHLTDLHKIARDSLSLVRQTVSGYKHRGLNGEVMELCARLRQNQFFVELVGDFPVLKPRAETALILALTELTTNVLRHSKGDSCSITFCRDDHDCIITFSDNGEISGTLTPGNGLDGVEKRLIGLGGCITLDTEQGCRFTIRLPISECKD